MANQRDPSDFEEEQKLYPEDYEELNDMLEFWASRASKATGAAYITWKDAKRFLPNLSDELLRDILQWYSKGQKVISATYNRNEISPRKRDDIEIDNYRWILNQFNPYLGPSSSSLPDYYHKKTAEYQQAKLNRPKGAYKAMPKDTWEEDKIGSASEILSNRGRSVEFHGDDGYESLPDYVTKYWDEGKILPQAEFQRWINEYQPKTVTAFTPKASPTEFWYQHPTKYRPGQWNAVSKWEKNYDLMNAMGYFSSDAEKLGFIDPKTGQWVEQLAPYTSDYPHGKPWLNTDLDHIEDDTDEEE